MVTNALPLIVLSQAGMTLYPLLIKLVKSNLETQTAIRFITYTILAVLGSLVFGNTNIDNFFPYTATEYIGCGMINIMHVVMSYVCFHLLPSGIGYTLFYTYPIFNVIGRKLFYNETIYAENIFYIGIAFLGVYILTQSSKSLSLSHNFYKLNENEKESFLGIEIDSSIIPWLGIGAGLLSSLTETSMYLLVKDAPKATTAFHQITRFYLFGGILAVVFMGYSLLKSPEKENIDILTIKWNSILEIALFNALIGFVGYTIVFYVVPRSDTIQFNTYIFLGIIFSYIWGYVLNGETIPTQNLLGLLLILFAIFMVNRN